ncbi:MAG: ATP-binding protein [Bacteroidia bacterium]|nr:ATP-binding protein [Bacteroidia bacterium]
MRKYLLLLAFTCCLIPYLFSQLPPINFEQIHLNKDFTSPHIYGIDQDEDGFLWLGTSKGVYRYDGSLFHSIQAEADSSSALSGMKIRAIISDQKGSLWFGTQGEGLFRYEISTNRLSAFSPDSSEHTPLNNQEILSLERGGEDILWVGSEGGLNSVNEKTLLVQSIPLKARGKKIDEPFSVLGIEKDSQGNIWVGSWQYGLCRLVWDQTKEGLKQAYLEKIEFSNKIMAKAPLRQVTSLHIDSQDRIVFGSLGRGLYITNPVTEQEIHFFKIKELSSLREQKTGLAILSSFIDSKGNIWGGSTRDLQIVSPIKSLPREGEDKLRIVEGRSISHQSIGTLGLPKGGIRCIFESKEGIIWIGAEGGLAKYSSQLSLFKFYPTNTELHHLSNVDHTLQGILRGAWMTNHDEDLLYYDVYGNLKRSYNTQAAPDFRLESNRVLGVYDDVRHKAIWIFGPSGITKLNAEGKKVHYLRLAPPGQSKIDYIKAFHIDPEGFIWIISKQAIYALDRDLSILKKYNSLSDIDPRLSYGKINDAIQSKGNTFWVASELSGLLSIQFKGREAKLMKRFIPFPDNPESLKNKYFFSLLKHKNSIWIGSHQGLLTFDPAKGEFEFYGEKEGLQNPIMAHLQVDELGTIWGVSNDYILRFDPRSKRFTHFGTKHGVRGGSFTNYYSHKSNDGTLLFRSNEGYLKLDPKQLSDEVETARCHFTELYLNGNLIQPLKTLQEESISILDQNLASTRELNIPPSQKRLEIRVSCIQYNFPNEQNNYYKLEGYDQKWRPLEMGENISYMNLEAASYTLRIRSGDLELDDQISLKINILPLFWETPLAKLLVGILLTMLIIGLFYLRSWQVLNQNRQLQKKVEERTRELKVANQKEKEARQKAEQATLTKSQFLANMSHEIRTPMNGILGMAELLSIENLSNEQAEYVRLIRKSGENLLTIINDILDFSKIDSGKFILEREPITLEDCMDDILGLLSSKTGDQALELLSRLDSNLPAVVWGDELRLKQILINLLGNSLKFTHKGEVVLEVQEKKRFLQGDQPFARLEFKVRDTGIGIPPEKLKYLFKAFTQVDASTTRKYGGTGLGLSISSHLCRLMGGELKVWSEEGQGSEFSFELDMEIKEEESVFSETYRSLSGKKVLIIDSEIHRSRFLISILEHYHMIVIHASDLEKAQSLVASESGIQALICNGLNDAKISPYKDWIKRNPDIKFIQLLPFSDLRENKQQGELWEIIKKPVRKSLLLTSLCELSELAKQNNHPPKPIPQGVFPSQEILLVEDNPINQKLALKIIQKLGLKAQLANNGKEAIECLRKRSFKIVLMDVQMPVMDGLEATRFIRSNFSSEHQPMILAMTANAMKGDKEMCLEAGMNDYISKPFKMAEIKDLLSKFLLDLA